MSRTHRRGRRPRRPFRWMTDDVGSTRQPTFAPAPMVRGRRPRNRIRWAVDGGGRTVGNVGAVGHAERVRLTRLGGHGTAGRRGRRPLRASAERRYPHRGNRYQHHDKQMRKGNHLCPPLGSPERGAVAALCAVTEGLVQGGCGEITSPVNRRRAGVSVGWRV